MAAGLPLSVTDSSRDVLTISRRVAHGSPVVTLTTSAHLFEKTDLIAATAMEATSKAKEP